jgi:hypothetical protein
VEDEGAACATGQKGNWICDVGILHRSVLWNALGNEMRGWRVSISRPWISRTAKQQPLAHSYTLHLTKPNPFLWCTVQQQRRQNPPTCTPGCLARKLSRNPPCSLHRTKQLPATRLHYTSHNAKLPGPGFEEEEIPRERTVHVCSPIRKARR